MAIPKYPIIDAVNNKGIKLGINETTTILNELNIKAIFFVIPSFINSDKKDISIRYFKRIFYFFIKYRTFKFKNFNL